MISAVSTVCSPMSKSSTYFSGQAWPVWLSGWLCWQSQLLLVYRFVNLNGNEMIQSFNCVALLHFPNVIRPNGSNSDSEMDNFAWVLTLPKMYSLIYRCLFHNVSQWEKVFLGCMALHNGPSSCDSTVWPL